MPQTPFDTSPGLLHRASGSHGAPSVIYLPGLHGDWTPMGRLRPLLARRFRLVEVAYPRRPRWSLGDHAAALFNLMDTLAIERAHLLGESFGSLVGWTAGLQRPERVRSLLIAGGFCQPVRPRGAQALAAWFDVSPAWPLDRGVDAYLWWIGYRRPPGARWVGRRRRWRHEPVSAKPACPEDEGPGGPCHIPFEATRTRAGWRTTANRLRIIAATDLRGELDRVRFGVGYLGGGRDGVVPVRREIATLRASLHADCRFRARLLPDMPHPILPAAPAEADAILGEWIEEFD